jgi:hypothetical protein
MSVTTNKNGNVEQITIRNHRTDHLLNEVQDAVINGFRIQQGTVRQGGNEIFLKMERNVSQGVESKTDSTSVAKEVKEVQETKSETPKVNELVEDVETVVEKPSPVKTKVTKAKTPVSK